MRFTDLLTRIYRRRTPLLRAAAALLAVASLLPIWGMILVSTQYPDGLRMIVYPTRIVGDLAEINALNHYIGMTPITQEFFLAGSNPSPQIVQWRWIFGPLIHGVGSLIVGFGAARLWRQAMTTGRPAAFDVAQPFIVTAAVFHGLYNGLALLLTVAGVFPDAP